MSLEGELHLAGQIVRSVAYEGHEVARLGFREVHDVCCGIDVVEDGVGAIDLMPTWNMDGSIAVRRMSVGRC